MGALLSSAPLASILSEDYMTALWGNQRYRRIIVFSTIYSLFALSHFLPPDFRYMIWEMRLRAVARTIHGFSEFMVFVFQAMTGGPTPLRTFIGITLVGPFVGVLLAGLWNSPTNGREIAVLLSVASILFGVAATYADSLLVGEPIRECRIDAGATRVLEIVNYPEIGWDPDRQLFLIGSIDGEQSWQQVMHIGPVSSSLTCGTLGKFDDEFFWYWIGWKLAITHDGGQTWLTWDINDLYPEWRCCEQRRINFVDFVDQMSGTMQGFFGSDQPGRLISNDGGETWEAP